MNNFGLGCKFLHMHNLHVCKKVHELQYNVFMYVMYVYVCTDVCTCVSGSNYRE